MRRAREAQLARLAARSIAADDDAAWRNATLRARVKVGAALRQALAQLAIDPANVAMLAISDAAARELAAAPDDPAPPPSGTPPPLADGRCQDPFAEAFAARIEALARRYRDGQGIDFARASLAEAGAWCLARLQNSAPPQSEEEE